MHVLEHLLPTTFASAATPDENHLYFDPGDGRLLTVFTDETRQDAGRHAPRESGCVEHLAFNVSRAKFALGAGSIA